MRLLALAPVALLALLGPACGPKARPAVPGPGGEAPVRVPPGCEASLAGDYHHAEDATFRYRAEDDGRTLTLTLVRAVPGPAGAPDAGTGGGAAPDAGTAAGDGAPGGITVRLQRTPRGFLGETLATGFTASGRPCPVRFPTELVACEARGLTLTTAASAQLGEGCEVAATGAAPEAPTRQVLLRGPPPSGR